VCGLLCGIKVVLSGLLPKPFAGFATGFFPADANVIQLIIIEQQQLAALVVFLQPMRKLCHNMKGLKQRT
jgi:hypothetical protein